MFVIPEGNLLLFLLVILAKPHESSFRSAAQNLSSCLSPLSRYPTTTIAYTPIDGTLNFTIPPASANSSFTGSSFSGE